MITIRKYKEVDFNRVSDIHDCARREELNAANLIEAFIPFEVAKDDENFFDYDVDVALIKDRVVEFVAYTNHELAWLYVDPKHKGKGVGKALVNHVVNVFDGDVVSLEVLKENKQRYSFIQNLVFLSLMKQVVRCQVMNRSLFMSMKWNMIHTLV